MKNFLFTLVFFLPFLTSVNGQDSSKGHHIEFDIKNYKNDSLVIAYYYGDRHLVHDTLISKKKGSFVMSGEEKLKPGVYLMLTRPDAKFIQFMVNDYEQNFKVKTDANALSKLKFKNSKDNELFQDYMAFLAKMRPKANVIKEELKDLDPTSPKHIVKSSELDKLDQEVADYQKKVVAENPNSITALIVKGNKSIEIPDFEGNTPQQKQQQFDYFKSHFFDYIELGNPASLRTPFLHTKIERYVEKLTLQKPDSVIQSIDFILDQVKPAEDTYKFYLSHFLNEAAKTKVVGFDAIYVHLMDNYYSKGMAPWVEEGNLKKLQKNANRLRPVLIGKTIDDISLFKEDGSEFKLSDVNTKYTVVMFWAPDCGHCTKAMPAAVEFNEKFKDRDVTFLAICTKTRDKFNSCWEAIEKKNMGGFLNLGDQFAKSRFKTKFNVRTTPKIFILDENREIIIKNIGSEQLEEIMEQIISFDESEGESND